MWSQAPGVRQTKDKSSTLGFDSLTEWCHFGGHLATEMGSSISFILLGNLLISSMFLAERMSFSWLISISMVLVLREDLFFFFVMIMLMFTLACVEIEELLLLQGSSKNLFSCFISDFDLEVIINRFYPLP